MNAIPIGHEDRHTGALDHTLDDIDGYMFVIDITSQGAELFEYRVSNLCIGSCYNFSAYLANVERPKSTEPNVRFEVQSAMDRNYSLARYDTGNIKAYPSSMTWSKYGLSFNASVASVALLIISNVGGAPGNDLAMDDIELSVCSPAQVGSYPPGG